MHPETPESAWFYETLAWLQVHKKQVIVGACAAVGVVAALYIYDWRRGQTERRASAALLQLRAMTGRQEAQPAAPAADFLKVAREFSSTQAGQRALLLAAGALFDEGKYTEAQAQFETFLSDYADSPLAPIAAQGVAASLDAQDKLDAALESYESIVARFPNDSAASRAKLNMASILESRNQPEKALRLYDELIKPAAMSGVAGEASMRKERLLHKHPNLAATNQTAGAAKPAPLAPATNKPAPTAANQPPATNQPAATKPATNAAPAPAATPPAPKP